MGVKDRNAANHLEELRAILLTPDRESQSTVMERLAELEKALVDDKAFEERLTPHLEAQVVHLQKNFPKLFGQFLGPAIKHQIEEEREVIIDALYPIIGKLIAKYLKEEIKRISERIDESMKDPFSLSTLKFRAKALFAGVSYQELLFREVTNRHKLEEIFIIQKDSGLSMAHYSLNEVTRSQMVAGMLTGIKSFLEDAFQKGTQELDTLEYEDYRIKIYPFPRFYVATVIEGSPDQEYERFLKKYVDEFCAKEPIPAREEVTQVIQDRLSLALKEHFHGFNQARDQ